MNIRPSINIIGLIIFLVLAILVKFSEPTGITLEHMELYYLGKTIGLFFMLLILVLSIKIEIVSKEKD